MEQKKGTQWVPKKQEDPGLLARLSRPTGPVDVVLDTDTYNEIDDQFAVSYLICSADFFVTGTVLTVTFFALFLRCLFSGYAIHCIKNGCLFIKCTICDLI